MTLRDGEAQAMPNVCKKGPSCWGWRCGLGRGIMCQSNTVAHEGLRPWDTRNGTGTLLRHCGHGESVLGQWYPWGTVALEDPATCENKRTWELGWETTGAHLRACVKKFTSVFPSTPESVARILFGSRLSDIPWCGMDEGSGSRMERSTNCRQLQSNQAAACVTLAEPGSSWGAASTSSDKTPIPSGATAHMSQE